VTIAVVIVRKHNMDYQLGARRIKRSLRALAAKGWL